VKDGKCKKEEDNNNPDKKGIASTWDAKGVNCKICRDPFKVVRECRGGRISKKRGAGRRRRARRGHEVGPGSLEFARS
jgi:hypothetical protein